MRAAFSLLSVATALSLVQGRKYSGSVNGDVNPFLGKFAFNSDPSGGVVGSATMTYVYGGTTTSTATVYMYDDDRWADVYPSMTCQQAINTWQDGSTGFSVLPLPPAAVGPQSKAVTETQRPHVWYFTAAVDCSRGVQFSSYTLELTQADGNQLGYDEIGMPSIYGVFWAIYAAGLVAHVWSHYYRANQPRFAPAMVRWFTASLSLIMGSYFCKMIDWATVSSNGVGSPAMGVIGDILRLGSLMALWVVCAMAATGYGVVSYKLDEKNYNWVGWLLLVALLCGYITLIVYFSIDVDPRASVSFGSVWPAITLLAVTFMYAGWWIWKIRQTYTNEVNITKKTLLRRLGLALLGNFFVLPFAYIVGAATPVYERTRVTTGLDIFVITCINIATTYALWPSNAQDAFRVYDGSSAAAMAMLEGGMGSSDGTEFHSALDEAYSYASMGKNDQQDSLVSREYSGAL